MENAKRIDRYFQLRPFALGPLAKKLSISGSLARESNTIQIKYLVEGALDLVCWSTPFQVVGRRHELWCHTCFEFFISRKNKSAYWEANFCPDGCWNVYRFTSYRTGMREEHAIPPPVWRVRKDGSFLSLSCIVDFNTVIDTISDLDVGVCSVVRTFEGSTTFWAAIHPGESPDFHNRESFILKLPGMEGN